jgi:hypothetical protein
MYLIVNIAVHVQVIYAQILNPRWPEKIVGDYESTVGCEAQAGSKTSVEKDQWSPPNERSRSQTHLGSGEKEMGGAPEGSCPRSEGEIGEKGCPFPSHVRSDKKEAFTIGQAPTGQTRKSSLRRVTSSPRRKTARTATKNSV